ncbi:hypothetical protein CC99x_007115 [Candidatus Berkiella cookevillensis]|uniref:Uncharacterized protein n=1 Tax=Candidatus Berkiella cookevillensis TaxID=437022 RepID=A0A0Q9YKY9_9GAMM|nr:hypothetical protein [Candidatus Berkiella cookevillensis]MCS5708676.1 hypothetical protein [Candidatus Berkiella cookevillensis]
MPKHTQASSGPSFKKTNLLLASAWDNIAERKIIDGLKDLAAVGGNAIASTAMGVTNFIKNKMNTNNMTAAQKILPFTLIAISVPVTVAAMVVTVAGLSTIAPPFMLAASVAAVVRSTGILLVDKKSLDNLNKQLITQDKLFKRIDKSKKLSDEQKHVVRNYIDLPEKIYYQLYALRQHVIENPDLSTEQKNKLIRTVNEQIENFHKGEISAIDFTAINAELKLSEKASPEIQKRISNINADLSHYKQAKDEYPKLPISSDLKSKVKHFKATHEHIYAQDLSPNTKQKMLALIEKPKMSRDDLKEVYAQMANHFVNTHSETQRAALDKTLIDYIKDSNPNIDAKQAQALAQHLSLPREIFYEVKKIHDNLLPEKQEAFRREVMDNIKKNPESLNELVPTGILAFMRENQINSADFKESFDKISMLGEKVKQLGIVVTDAKASDQKEEQQSAFLAQHRVIPKVELPTEAVTLLNQHRNAALIDYIQTGGINVESPNVSNTKFMQPRTMMDGKAGKYLYEKVGKHVEAHIKDKITSPFENMAVKAKTKLMEKYYGKEKAVEIMATKKSKSQARAEFRDQFSDAHTFLRKAEERNFLKKAVPRDLLNVGLSAINVLVTGVSTIVLPVAFSPGAPAAVGVGIGLGVVSAGLTTAAVTNSAVLMAQHERSMDKTHSANEKAVRVTTPDMRKEVRLNEQLHKIQDKKDQKRHAKEEKKQEKAQEKQAKALKDLEKTEQRQGQAEEKKQPSAETSTVEVAGQTHRAPLIFHDLRATHRPVIEELKTAHKDETRRVKPGSR